MAIFKQRVSAPEYGTAILYLAKDWIRTDALGAIGRCFPNSDGSSGWQAFLESVGYGERELSPYLRMAYHSALQATALQYDLAIRRDLVLGAMSRFQVPLVEYQPDRMFAQLEQAYQDHDLQEEERLGEEWKISFLPKVYQTAHVTNGKILFESYLRANFKHADHIVANFATFCSGLGSCIGVAERARQQVSKQAKL